LVRRMRPGDVVLAVVKRRQVLALGIVQSDPKPAVEAPWSTYREVQWLRVLADEPLDLPGALSPAAAGRLRGSALQLVQSIFDR
jgi:hypothetical protein